MPSTLQYYHEIDTTTALYYHTNVCDEMTPERRVGEKSVGRTESNRLLRRTDTLGQRRRTTWKQNTRKITDNGWRYETLSNKS